MNDDLRRELLAELIGTFVLVFVGSAAVLAAPIFGVVVPALAHGLILCALIYTYGHISGAQVNPAVSLGLAVGGEQDWNKTAYYIVAQFIGGIVAAAVLVMVFPQENAGVAGFLGENAYNFGQTTGFLTAESVWTAAVYEAILDIFPGERGDSGGGVWESGQADGRCDRLYAGGEHLGRRTGDGRIAESGADVGTRADRGGYVVFGSVSDRHIWRRHHSGLDSGKFAGSG